MSTILLAQFQTSTLWHEWVNLRAGVWYINLDGSYPLVDDELDSGMPTKAFESNIGSVVYQNEFLDSVESVGELSLVSGFYWDRDTRTLYASFPYFDPPDRSIRIGILYSVSTEHYDGQEGTIFKPHLKSLPPLDQEKDRLFFKKLSTGSWTMVLENAGLDYDGLPDWGVYNQSVQYFIGDSEKPFTEFEPIRAGRVKDFYFTGFDAVLNVQDLRSRLSVRIPDNTFSVAEYPDIDPDLEGNIKPVAFGRLFGVKPICINSEDGSGPYVFMVADGSLASIESITEVRIDETVTTPTSIDLDAGTFTLTSAQVKDGDSFKKVEVDFSGFKPGGTFIENPLDILTTLMEWFADTSYNDTYFDTFEWNQELSGKPACAIFIDSKTELLSIVEDFSTSTRGGLLITNDGRYTWRTPDYARSPGQYVKDQDWIEEPEVLYDTSETLAYVGIEYHKYESTNDMRTLENRSFQDFVYASFGIQDNESFETILVDEADAATLAADIMELSHDPAIVVSGKTPLKFFDLRVGYNLQVDVNRFVNGAYRPWLGTLQGEILKVAPNVLEDNVEITMKVVEGIPEYVEPSGITCMCGNSIYGLSIYGGD